MSPVKVEAHFNFSGACSNCWCGGHKDDSPLYINKNLEIEPWKRKRADSHSLSRSAARVHAIVQDKIKEVGIDQDVAHELVMSKLDFEMYKRPITKRDLSEIIRAIQKVHEDVLMSSGGSNGK